MPPGRSAGPRRRRGATREGVHPAWQGVTPDLIRQSNRKPGIPASRAKPLPRSAGVRSRVLVFRFSLLTERAAAWNRETAGPTGQCQNVPAGRTGRARRWCVHPLFCCARLGRRTRCPPSMRVKCTPHAGRHEAGPVSTWCGLCAVTNKTPGRTEESAEDETPAPVVGHCGSGAANGSAPPWCVTPPGRRPSPLRRTGGRRWRPAPAVPRTASRSRR